MIQIIFLLPALFIFLQGVSRLVGGPKSEKETPYIAKRNGIIFTIVGGLLIIFAIGIFPILSGTVGFVEFLFTGR